MALKQKDNIILSLYKKLEELVKEGIISAENALNRGKVMLHKIPSTNEE